MCLYTSGVISDHITKILRSRKKNVIQGMKQWILGAVQFRPYNVLSVF